MGPHPVSNAATADTPPRVSPEIAAEAAVWVARLHGPDRSVQMERECLAWQARSAVHREAFERCTETWEDIPRISLASAYASVATTSAVPGLRRARWVGGAVGVVLVGAAALVTYWRNQSVYGTGVGEQQLVVLADGTRMSLNTNTHVRVALGSSERTVNVRDGEVLFEVAKDSRRPFVVSVAGSKVFAHGTVFAVRYAAAGAAADNGLAVTLLEGHVTVELEGEGRPVPDQQVQMEPGERLRLVGTGAAAATRVDRPDLEQVVAWKRSEAIFGDASLGDAVAEMNRYSRTPIVLIGDQSLTDLRVSGIYHTGDNLGFARAVAALHGLAVHEREGRLELAKAQ